MTPKVQSESDQNGQPFERLQVFSSRIGPTFAKVEAAQALEWSSKELTALVHGLESYTGPNVFISIFRKHCQKNGALHQFNVTEIVSVAAMLKSHLTEVHEKENGVVQDWVKQIPDWTKGQSFGKENDDSEVDADNDEGVEI